MDARDVIRQAISMLSANGLTFKEIGERLGVSQQAAHKYSYDQKVTPNGNVLIKAIEAIGGDINRAMPEWEETSELGQAIKEARELNKKLADTINQSEKTHQVYSAVKKDFDEYLKESGVSIEKLRGD